MIERILGNLTEKSPTFCVVDCHGVGLGLHISLNTFQKLEKFPENTMVSLYAYLHVREDVLQLYGFFDVAEREMFQLLISISGVGPRLAIAVLSGSTAEELRSAIVREDVAMLTRIPGVGKKTAQRLVLELKEKIQKRGDIERLVAISSISQQVREKVNEAMLALVSLGYKQQEAQAAIDKVLKRSDSDLSLEEIIKQAFKEM
jgi:Holliday junction DNA helicase RuvA